MPPKAGEVQLAQIVEDRLALERRPLGQRQDRDGDDDSGLTVDFTYDNASPPVALEITRLMDSKAQETIQAARLVEEHLDRLARKARCGQWVVAVQADARMKRLQAPLRTHILAGKEITLGFNPFISELDPDRDAKRALSGLVSLERLGDRRHGVSFMVHAADQETGPSLQNTLEGKATPLAKCEGYERHLLVHVEAYGGRPLGGSPPPVEVPDAIDVLWLSWGWPLHGKPPRGLARLRRPAAQWELLVGDRR